MPSFLRSRAVALLVLAAMCFVVTPVQAKPKPKRYLMDLTTVTLADGVIADEALLIEVVTRKAKEALAATPQFATSIAGAPNAATDPKGWKRWLGKQNLAGGYKVNLEIIAATEDVEPNPAKSGQRLTVSLTVRMFGETLPARKMGFTGEGSATIKQEIGKKLRDADRLYAWEGAIEQAMTGAIATALAKIAGK